MVVSLLGVAARPALATTVAIMRPAPFTADAGEALSRLHGELLSVGFEVKVVERPAMADAGADALAWLEPVAAEQGAKAILAIVGEPPLAVDVWVVRTQPSRFELSRVAVDPGTANPYERLALRAIEALRASLLEIDLAARERRQAPLPPTATLSRPSPKEELATKRSLGLELGAAAVMGLDGVGPALLPMLRLTWALGPRFLAQAAWAGPGTRGAVTTSAGDAHVAQQFGTLAGCYRFRPQRRWWPFMALAAGVLRTSAEGQDGASTQGHTVRQWSFLMDGSVGTGVQPFSRYYLTLALHVQLAEPYLALHFLDTVGATAGRPNLLLTLTVGAWL